MTKLDLLDSQKIEILIKTLKTLREDAVMALNGEWDTTSKEGIETGFNDQIELIDDVLSIINKK